MDKQTNCWQITFEPQSQISEELELFWEEYFDVLACNYVDDILEEYVGYISPSFNQTDFEAKAKEKNLSLPPYKIEALANKNWLKETVIQFAPIETKDFLIYGVHEPFPPKTRKIPVKVFAATAFGSSHQTTFGCLEAISYLHDYDKFSSINILDVGTGSGILSIAAAKLWPKAEVTAVDIDPESVRVATQNAKDNGVENIAIGLSDGYRSTLIKPRYTLILSNILARPLIDMKQSLYEHLSPNGYCILSGFNLDQEEWVMGEYEALGFELLKTFIIDNWCATILRKTK